jgi:hypothetical protein
MRKKKLTIQRLVKEAETDKILSIEWIDLFRSLSKWLIQKCKSNRIPFPNDNNLESFCQKASIILDNHQKNILQSSALPDYYNNLQNEITILHNLIYDLMFSFKSQLLWFFHCCDKNHIEIENLVYLLTLMNQSEKIRDNLENQLLADESLQSDKKAKTDGDFTEPLTVILIY